MIKCKCGNEISEVYENGVFKAYSCKCFNPRPVNPPPDKQEEGLRGIIANAMGQAIHNSDRFLESRSGLESANKEVLNNAIALIQDKVAGAINGVPSIPPRLKSEIEQAFTTAGLMRKEGTNEKV